jgi:endonuclease III related protein
MLNEVYNILLDQYGKQGWWPLKGVYSGKVPKGDEIFEVCLGAILTQNTSWTNVEKALENLGEASRARVLTSEELSLLIRPAGYYNQKVKKIKEFISFLESGASVTRESLLGVWGIGPETADSMLLYGYGQKYFVIDAYTKRIFSRLGVSEGDYAYWQELFHGSFEGDVYMYKEYHALIVEHAKRHCKVKPSCEGCCLKGMCKF